MHILIGIITALASLIWALVSLQKAGFDINALNPFTWMRRRKWAAMYGTRPIHNIDNPMEVAAVLIVGILKEEGEISREQKAAVIDLFEGEFKLSSSKAVDTFAASLHLLKDEINFEQSIKAIVAPSRDRFTSEQIESLLALLQRVAIIEGLASESQQQIIAAVERELKVGTVPNSTWH